MRRNVWWVTALCILIGACAAPIQRPVTHNQDRQEWSGRLSLQVQSEPPQQLNAGFNLQGEAKAGQLDLTSPIGTTLASLQWTPQEALLWQGDQPLQFTSMDELTVRLTGTQIPLHALFDWLHGIPTPAAGWQPDVSQRDSGWVTATRSEPAPAVMLKIKLD